ncbi:MAG: hypothetical protein ACI9PC_001459 [Porticoccaceae bacterium]
MKGFYGIDALRRTCAAKEAETCQQNNKKVPVHELLTF